MPYPIGIRKYLTREKGTRPFRHHGQDMNWRSAITNVLTDSEVAILFISPWRTFIMRANGLEGSPGLLNSLHRYVLSLINGVDC